MDYILTTSLPACRLLAAVLRWPEPRLLAGGIYDLHNHGCVSFISMIGLAQSLLTTSGGKRALICNVQTAAGRVFADEEVPSLAAIPGDTGVVLHSWRSAMPQSRQ